MEGIVLQTQLFGPTVVATGLAVLLAVSIAGLVFGYIADEERKGRRIDWLEEPLTAPYETRQAQEGKGVKLPRAA